MNALKSICGGIRRALHNFIWLVFGFQRDDEPYEQWLERMDRTTKFCSLYSAVVGTVALVLAVIRVLQRVGVL